MATAKISSTGSVKAGDSLFKVRENPDLNQYWYSRKTIEKLVYFLQTSDIGPCAFLSTPSLYFSLNDAEFRSKSVLFDFDMSLKRDEGCEFFDYRMPLEINDKYRGVFDCVVIDPPFISEYVWKLYAQSASFLLKPKEVRSKPFVEAN